MPVKLGVSEEEFLANISKRLGRPTPQAQPQREVIGTPDFWQSWQPSPAEMLKKYTENVEQLTVRVVKIPDIPLLQAQIKFWLSEIKAQSVICVNTPQMEAADIPSACRGAGARVVVWNPNSDRKEMIRECAEVDVGVTWADYAIARTGTLAHFCSPLKGRSVSLLPPIHIAIVSMDRFVPRLGDVLRLMAEKKESASALNLITGPSRTADIEMDLTLGVHGPGKLYVAVLDQPSFH